MELLQSIFFLIFIIAENVFLVSVCIIDFLKIVLGDKDLKVKI